MWKDRRGLRGVCVRKENGRRKLGERMVRVESSSVWGRKTGGCEARDGYEREEEKQEK